MNNYLRPLIAKGWLAPTIPEKPRSRLQCYITTEGGRRWLAESSR
jgi:ATP-dependent DNA helicase RecG